MIVWYCMTVFNKLQNFVPYNIAKSKKLISKKKTENFVDKSLFMRVQKNNITENIQTEIQHFMCIFNNAVIYYHMTINSAKQTKF